MNSESIYYLFLLVMVILGFIVFVLLHYVTAGYGMFQTDKWGVTINNRIGWCIMEIVSMIGMLIFYVYSSVDEIVPIISLILFVIHYFRRSIIFPLRMSKGGKMPIIIMLMGMVFNLCNCYVQAGWLFLYHPPHYYLGWFNTPQCYFGVLVFFVGMAINVHSDEIIRNLRKEGETEHKLPQGGLFDYVTSAQYFGELVEWLGFSIFTLSPGAIVFFLWTFANLMPRARSVHLAYRRKFKNQVGDRKILIPFIY
ncbi:steroid 5-alpha reductase, putative [Entamoeba histolytica HM-1:IMSS-B]|uniref:3-oxo-5-alpha-steroid 4-dehydrogenase 1 n=6 Tax=Entamoeba histolytica TaxID=5759 RepID=C4LVC4_ENTH1|nr:steroid 5-alpha reductase, putative [Entamoeba histolytica HM-1:IMSS]EMD43893.1 steroid 5 alpha reductase, putative [Entamoeba histolytica KU27]EMH77249.1 steroid 5-alpha reductase, putative [Entamoeba histolytica HM-1:IMSS-B]EMS18033.1 steroid 5-alpha reductase, putative [Entamoeba histolytica HM-3:IMSS]ENY65920.1 steroid 5-alpha reductase, putative [Entamoeba histolytica HM-1:IMSS-A]GAT92611.1 steroid 5-alpha reductase putative [Entamoeba histolytica]|eukprot:XP_653147.1 steroid 5-alpha reductase, putative [Entamoeba histolytica HM-1:IMSS]